MTLQRKPHWETRAFHDFLLARAATPFAWGSNDCALFAADAVLAITGQDIAAEFRGRYADEDGALAAIREIAGGATVEDAAEWCARNCGMREWISPLLAQRGDLVCVDNGGTVIAGVVHLNGRHVVTMAQDGLVRLPITATRRAWSY